MYSKFEFEYLPISPDEMPIKKIYTIGGLEYNYLFQHNSRTDTFTLTISSMEEDILYSTRLTYGMPVINALVEGLVISERIIPFNFDDYFSSFKCADVDVNSGNLDKTVRLYLEHDSVI